MLPRRPWLAASSPSALLSGSVVTAASFSTTTTGHACTHAPYVCMCGGAVLQTSATALHLAVWQGDVTAVQLLLAAGADKTAVWKVCVRGERGRVTWALTSMKHEPGTSALLPKIARGMDMAAASRRGD